MGLSKATGCKMLTFFRKFVGKGSRVGVQPDDDLSLREPAAELQERVQAAAHPRRLAAGGGEAPRRPRRRCGRCVHYFFLPSRQCLFLVLAMQIHKTCDLCLRVCVCQREFMELFSCLSLWMPIEGIIFWKLRTKEKKSCLAPSISVTCGTLWWVWKNVLEHKSISSLVLECTFSW